MYKVIVDTVAIMDDGTLGNINQGRITFYTNCDLTRIEEKINDYLLSKKLVCQIVSTEYLKNSYVIEIKD